MVPSRPWRFLAGAWPRDLRHAVQSPLPGVGLEDQNLHIRLNGSDPTRAFGAVGGDGFDCGRSS
jgi:hypothetical protein